MGVDHDTLLPRSRPRSSVKTAHTSTKAPRKSIRRNLAFQLELSSFGSLSATPTRPMARAQSGTWPRKAQRHPILSARIPPSGAPVPAPVAYMILIIPCQVPRSRSGTISLMITDTTVVMPPPPIPAKALAAMSSFISRASPQKRQPTANMM